MLLGAAGGAAWGLFKGWASASCSECSLACSEKYEAGAAAGFWGFCRGSFVGNSGSGVGVALA